MQMVVELYCCGFPNGDEETGWALIFNKLVEMPALPAMGVLLDFDVPVGDERVTLDLYRVDSILWRDDLGVYIVEAKGVNPWACELDAMVFRTAMLQAGWTQGYVPQCANG